MSGNHVSESVIEAGVAVSSKTTIAGAAASVVGWAAQINWIGLAGVGIALLGLLVNAYFQHRRDRREQAESEARVRALNARCGVDD